MADKSLDDVIRERKISANRRGRGRFPLTRRNFSGGRAQSFTAATGIKARLGNSQARSGNSKPVSDARERLIAKARTTDARLKLNQKARQGDARARINAKRVKLGPKGDNDSLPQNKKAGGLTRTISNTKGQNAKSLQLSVRNHDTVPQTQFTVRNTSPEPELFTVRNTSATNLSVRKRISPPRKSPSDNLQVVISNSGREKFRSSGRLQLGGSLQQSPTTKSSISLRQRPAMDSPQLGLFASAKIQRVAGNTLDTGGPLRLGGTTRTRPVEGTRVVITNLQKTVTEEDIKELFGALGVLKRVRMVKQGLAEVIYSKRESALKAISTYHNRELDGKAMQCKLDSSSIAEGAPFKKNAISDRFKTYSSDNNPSLPYRSTIPATTVVELADEIIDKVLFKLPVQSASSSKPVIFTVKI